MQPTSRHTAEHYTWPSAGTSHVPNDRSSAIGPQQCDGWHLHRSAGLSVIEERMPPGTAEQRHLHRQATQFFYVLAGELTLELDGVLHSLPVGTGCTVVAQTPHQVFNRGEEDARFLVISEPPSHADRVTPEPASGISGR
jgi:mannose-6-phosphate isomerase-like protein (cupin superfamily)